MNAVLLNVYTPSGIMGCCCFTNVCSPWPVPSSADLLRVKDRVRQMLLLLLLNVSVLVVLQVVLQREWSSSFLELFCYGRQVKNANGAPLFF